MGFEDEDACFDDKCEQLLTTDHECDYISC